jgi:hypothetical protein
MQALLTKIRHRLNSDPTGLKYKPEETTEFPSELVRPYKIRHLCNFTFLIFFSSSL